MKHTLLCLLAVVITSSCGTTAPPTDETITTPSAPEAEAAPAIPDSAIGLAPGTAFEQPAQAPISFNTVDPGESELHPRPNAEFPPVIPHSAEGMSIIRRTENMCMDCHAPDAAPDFDATALPPSHQVDLRHSPDSQGTEVVGARWVCTSCHVAQTDASPLVEITSRS